MQFILDENKTDSSKMFTTPEKKPIQTLVCPTQVCTICHENGVKRFASYCFIGEKRPTRCAKHSTDEMIPPPSRCCKHEGCGKTASFNEPNVKGVRFCATHKTEGMVSKTNKKSVARKLDFCGVLV